MRFLITGITGFVGYHLAKHLVVKGHDVYGLTHNHIPLDKRNKGVKYIDGDLCRICDLELLKNFEFDGVFHLAALTHPPTSFNKLIDYFQTNTLGTINLCEVLKKSSVIMQCSTPEVYGICENEIFETFPMCPMNPYGVSKASADLYILERTRNNELNAFITRAGSHTGWGRPSCYSISSDAIQIIRIKKGLQKSIIKIGNINSQRAVIDVRDVVIAYYELMMKYITKGIGNGEIFHIGGGIIYPIEYYLNIMMEIAGVKADKVIDASLIRKVDIPIQILNSDKVRSVISWEPIIPIEETLKNLLDYWEEKV